MTSLWYKVVATNPTHPRGMVLPMLVIATLIGGLCLVALGARPVAAHAYLDESDPANNAILTSAPQLVTLRFTEPLERSYSQAELYDQDGNQVPDAASRAGDDDFAMVVDLPSDLPNGTYSVLWRTLSMADGHTAQGYISFTIGTEADVQIVTPPATASIDGPPGWVETTGRWLALLGLAAAVAIWPIWLFVLRPAISPAWQAGPRLTRRAHRFAIWALVLAVAGSVVALLVQAATIGSGDSRYVDQLLTTVGETRYGRLWLIRIGLFLIYAVLLTAVGWWWPRRRPVEAGIGLVLAAALALPFSLIAHAAAQPAGRTVAIAADLMHLLAASLWIGGLFVLLGVLLPTLRDLTPAGRRVVLSRALPRFSVIALIAWGVMGLTGAYSAWLQVGNFAGLRETDYGRSLTLKVALLVPLLALGAFNLLIVTKRLKRAADGGTSRVWTRRFGFALGAEAALVVLVLLVVGQLIGQAPAREVLADRADRITLEFQENGRQATLSLTPGTTGINHFRLDAQGAFLPAETVAVLRLSLPSQGTGETEIQMTRAAGNAFEHHGSEFSMAGEWTARLIIRSPGEQDWTATNDVAIATTPPQVNVPGAPWRFERGGLPGMILLALGIAGVVLAWAAGRTSLRKESAGIGTVAIALGMILLLQARIDPRQAELAAIPENPIVADAASVTRGSDIYAANCLACHGVDGRGDGPAGVGMIPPPADFGSAHARLHLDQDLFYWIENGKPGTGMPAFGDELDEDEIWDVLNYIRHIQDQVAADRDVPAPESCDVEPRSLDTLRALSATPATSATGGPEPISMEGAIEADEETIEEITEVARDLIACSNARDTMRRLAFFSDDNLRPAFANGPSDSFADIVATPPTPLPEPLQMAIVAIDNVRVLEDGRVSASITIDNPSMHTHGPPEPGTSAAEAQQQTGLIVFVRDGDRWLIDQVS